LPPAIGGFVIKAACSLDNFFYLVLYLSKRIIRREKLSELRILQLLRVVL
jgi:hypothetical protein